MDIEQIKGSIITIEQQLLFDINEKLTAIQLMQCKILEELQQERIKKEVKKSGRGNN